MMRFFGTIALICALLFLFAASIGNAAECSYGSVQAWFCSSDGIWKNATAHPVLQRGESFEIKIRIQIKTDLRVVYLKLHEFGTPAYEVIAGPSIMEQLLEHWRPSLDNQSTVYLWKMRVRANTSWTNGNSPLEVYVQFTKNDADDASVTFDVLNAFILDEVWENYSSKTINDNLSKQNKNVHQLSHPSIVGVLFIFVLSGIFLRKRQHR